MGIFDLAGVIEGGIANGWHAARHAGFSAANVSLAAPEIDEIAYAIEPAWEMQQAVRGKAFVDFQNDVTLKDVKLAHREGYQSVEHLKRYTTLGMGTDQGKTSNINALAIMAGLREVTCPKPARPLSARPIRRWRWERSPDAASAIISARCAGRRFMTGTSRMAAR